MGRVGVLAGQQQLPGIDCGCKPVCRIWERYQQSGRLFDRASKNLVEAHKAWTDHIDELAREAA